MQNDHAQLRFRALFNQSSYAMVIFDMNGNAIDANPAWELLFKQKASEVLGGYNLFRDSQARVKGLAPYIEAGYTGKPVRIPPIYYEPSEIGKTGRPRWLEMVISPIKNPDEIVIGLVLIMKDITDQVLYQKKLEEKILQFSTLANSVSELVWIYDRDGYVDYFNNNWEELLGQTLAKGETWFSLFHPKDLGALASIHRSILQNNEFNVKIRLRDRSGDYHLLLVKGILMKDANGKITNWMGVATKSNS